MSEKKSCTFAGFNHPEGSKICRNGVCMKCAGGKWEDTGTKCPCR